MTMDFYDYMEMGIKRSREGGDVSDRLEEIKEKQRHAVETHYWMPEGVVLDADPDMEWLISEVERLREAVEGWKKSIDHNSILSLENERLRVRCREARVVIDTLLDPEASSASAELWLEGEP